MLKRNNNRKGFTLAELLIVVAIIAVLVAIAVPLFVGGLNNAKEGTFKANQRAVKSAAVVQLLNSTDASTKIDTYFAAGNAVFAEAVVSDDGEIGSITIYYGVEADVKEAHPITENYDKWKAEANGNKICVQLTKTDLTTAAPEIVTGKQP